MIWSNSRTGGVSDLRFTNYDLHDLEKSDSLVDRKSQIVNPKDGSVMRLIPAGEFIMGSTPEQIEAARLMDIGGHEFTLLDELPQFRTHLPDVYLSEHAVTNQQFAAFAKPGLLPNNSRIGFRRWNESAFRAGRAVLCPPRTR
jgi:formylglycine-generating enzyme required for sulfatase activity